MLMQLIHRLVDLDRLRGAFNWKDGAVYFPTSMFPPTHPIHCLSYHGWWVSLLTSLLRGLPPPKSGNLGIVKPKKWFKHPFWAPTPISLVLWLGRVSLYILEQSHQFWVIRFKSSLIDCQIWLKLPRVPGNFKPGWNFLRLYISVLGLLELGGGSAMCTDIHTNIHVCRSRWNVHLYVSGGNVVLPLSSVIWRGRLYCQLSVFRGLCHLEKLSENTFSRKGLFGRQRWWWLEKEASSFRRLSPEGGRGVNLVFDRAPAHDY